MPQARTYTDKELRAMTHAFTFWNADEATEEDAEVLEACFGRMSILKIIIACESDANLRPKLPSSLKERLRAKNLISF